MSDDDGVFDDLIDPLDLFDFDGDGKHSSVEEALALDEFERDERAIETGSYEKDTVSPDKDTETEDDDSTDDFNDSTGFFPADSQPEHTSSKPLSERLQTIYQVINGEDWDSDNPERLKRCQYIIAHQEQSEMRYLNADGRILYGQCANENFSLPIVFKSEDAEPKLLFQDVFYKIARHDLTLALDFWKWCFEHFMPYREYLDEYEATSLTDVISNLDNCSDNAFREFTVLLTAKNEFLNTWISSIKTVPLEIGCVFKEMFEIGKPEAAESLMKRVFSVPEIDYSDTEFQVKEIIRECTDYEDLTALKGLLKYLFPIIESMGDEPIKRRVPEWLSTIKEHIDYVESENPKYAYSGKNAWRMKYQDNRFSIDPTEFECEADFLNEVKEQTNGWKKRHARDNNFGVDMHLFENERAFTEAVQNAKNENIKRRNDEIAAAREIALKDKTVYTYYGVLFQSENHPYHYFAHEPFQLGDTVIVPTGDSGDEQQGLVVSVEQHLRITAPYPPEKTKFISKKASQNR